ncbi:MAG: cytochrome d ubiquinol oxidase subunit II [Holophagaceae bacterium]|uniref:Cytochrome d ubiquinol oxidase subunit II n=1 Tax=Candidatus Geothrix skivensis TaxID=2954439 RepID=A0A9D7XGR5_9BACT|nr:cytochrome d ubiquinol oxidase subunit II [Candidatus Geothrix skivensis]
MHELWFWLVAVMIAIYVVMDGFDFGAGILHLFVAKTNEERREVLGAIGPFWDGNEVWLLAGGGSLFLAFPKVLAAGFSGFYLAMWLVVWSLMLRGISIEFRSHVQDGLWRHFWDGTFALSSVLLPVLFGAALGNVLRGVPLDATGTFRMPLWTDFRLGAQPGVLDWFTVLIGVFALTTVTAHGALFLAWKTEGPVHDRSKALARSLWGLVLVLWILATYATHRANPAIYQNLPRAPLAWLASLIFLGGLGAVFVGLKRARFLLAFLGSGAFILGLLAATAANVYPVMLRSTLAPAYDLTALNASVGGHGLRTGLVWWLIGFPIAIGYVLFLFRFHRGKVRAPEEGEGY